MYDSAGSDEWDIALMKNMIFGIVSFEGQTYRRCVWHSGCEMGADGCDNYLFLKRVEII
jgi:pyruvate-formate lyase-activating enzyme